MSSRLPRRIVVAYALPALPAALIGVPLLYYLPTFYAGDLGLGVALITLAHFAVRLWDLVAGLLAGWASDRWPTRYGRRRPWFAGGLVVLAAGVCVLFRPPEAPSLAYFAAAALVVYLGWTMLTISYQAWGAELSADYHERSVVVAAREGSGLAGVALSAAIPTLLLELGVIAPEQNEAKTALAAVGVLVVVLLPLAGAILLRTVPETSLPTHLPTAGRGGIRRLAGNAPLRRLLAACGLNGIATAMLAVMFPTALAWLRLLEHHGLFLIVFFVAGIVGIPVWLRYARRHGKHRAWCLALAFAAVSLASTSWLAPHDFVAVLAICLALGFAFGADVVLPLSMQADVVDVDTAAGGARRAGLYFALLGTMGKLALAAGALAGWAVANSVDLGLTLASAEAGLQQRVFLTAGVAAALKIAVVLLMWRYPLDAAAQAELRRRIASA